MHSSAVRNEILALAEAGENDCEIARRTGVARTTVRDIRSPNYERKGPAARCWRCWGPTKPVRFSDADYAELLGYYLGDGCISRSARTERLRITLDASYPVTNANLVELLGRCFPGRQIGMSRAADAHMEIVSVYARHLSCLFPQDGSGKKHERDVSLEPWQAEIVRHAPFSALRGLLMSDGCHFVNRTGPYEYFSYSFSNMSTEILDLFCACCDQVGVVHRRTPRQIRINHRASVALVLEHVGVKA